ncbi:hypothetical protein NQZ68_012692 [Dissostichus eleginoides]|nr:hypothetical protein NQZ68_012692 [Dissostichus eleginoides]
MEERRGDSRRGGGYKRVRRKGGGYKRVKRKGGGYKRVKRKGEGYKRVRRKGGGYKRVRRKGGGYKRVRRKGGGYKRVKRKVEEVIREDRRGGNHRREVNTGWVRRRGKGGKRKDGSGEKETRQERRREKRKKPIVPEKRQFNIQPFAKQPSQSDHVTDALLIDESSSLQSSREVGLLRGPGFARGSVPQGGSGLKGPRRQARSDAGNKLQMLGCIRA